jgi:hypothetical protein
MRLGVPDLVSSLPAQQPFAERLGNGRAERDQGAMSVDRLVEAIKLFARRKRVLGVDVCGDYSPPRFADPFRAALAHSDHQAKPAPTPEMPRRNATTNERLLACCEEVFA